MSTLYRNKLIPLHDIPRRGGARDAERDARALRFGRDAALRAARWEIVDAPGCGDDTHGYLLTREAAEALCETRANPPGGTAHAIYDYRAR